MRGSKTAATPLAVNRSLTTKSDHGAMVIRRRMRAILYPLVLYCVSGAVGSYFVWHAVNGERGLKTKDEYEQRLATLREELKAVRAEQALWEQRISMMRGPVVDRDLLEEAARTVLGRVDKNELVVLVPSPAAPAR
jgi:cell division protein FtsB